MTYKQIEAARETRLWLCQVIGPLALGVGYLASKPAVREFVADKVTDIKSKIKFKKN